MSLKLFHCVMSSPKCTCTTQSLSVHPHPGLWLPLFYVSFDTVELCNFESDHFWKYSVRKSCTMCYLEPLPLAQPLSSGPCYQSLPVLHYRYGCASLFSLLILWLLSDLNLRLGLRPVSPLQLLLHNLVLCHLTSSGISESWSIMDPHMVQLLSSTPSILHSESSRAALTYSKSLSSQHTLPPHLHHASKTLTVGNFLSCFLCWNEQMESHDQSRWTCDRGV